MGTIVHDHDRSYYSYGSYKISPECLAHVLRYLVGAIENEPHLTWHKQMRMQNKNVYAVVITSFS